jgi:hypothetical protein
MDDYILRVFENRMLRRICRLERKELTGGWKKIHSKELHNLHSLPHKTMVMKSRRMR